MPSPPPQVGGFNMVCQKLSRSTPGSPPARTGDRGEKLGGRGGKVQVVGFSWDRKIKGES